jgi:hypothetical protein
MRDFTSSMKYAISPFENHRILKSHVHSSRSSLTNNDEAPKASVLQHMPMRHFWTWTVEDSIS